MQGSHVVQPKKVTPLRISAQEPGRRRASAKNAGKTWGLEAKKTVVRGKFRGQLAYASKTDPVQF